MLTGLRYRWSSELSCILLFSSRLLFLVPPDLSGVASEMRNHTYESMRSGCLTWSIRDLAS